MSQPPERIAAENAARLRELLELVRLRVARVGPLGADIHLRLRVDRGGRIVREVKLTVEESLQSDREGA